MLVINGDVVALDLRSCLSKIKREKKLRKKKLYAKILTHVYVKIYKSAIHKRHTDW
jgi:hypothetical protein